MVFQEKNYRFELPKVLAVLIAEEGNYAYVDKIGYAQSRDLLLFHVREALRDLQPLLHSETIKKLRIDYGRVENDLKRIVEIKSSRELREISSLIAGEALALASRLAYQQEVERR